MLGTVAGEPKNIVTNVSVQMSHDFSKIMQQILRGANEGKLVAKSEAVQRRDQLVGKRPVVPADSAAPTDSVPTADHDRLEDRRQGIPVPLGYT